MLTLLFYLVSYLARSLFSLTKLSCGLTRPPWTGPAVTVNADTPSAAYIREVDFCSNCKLASQEVSSKGRGLPATGRVSIQLDRRVNAYTPALDVSLSFIGCIPQGLSALTCVTSAVLLFIQSVVPCDVLLWSGLSIKPSVIGWTLFHRSQHYHTNCIL